MRGGGRERGGISGDRELFRGLSAGEARINTSVNPILTKVDITQPEQEAKQSGAQTIAQSSDT